MGEKERGTLEEESRQTQQSSFGERAARPREAGSQREGGGVMHEDTWSGQRLSAEDGGGGGAPDPAETIIKSKSNITNNRETGPGGGDDDDLDEASINNTKSNIKSRTAGPGGGGGGEDDGSPEARATNLNSSRSNVYRTAGPGDDDPAQAAINNSHSNIKNLRSGGPGDSGGEGDDDGSPEERASNLNLSKSNINRTSAPDGDSGAAGLAIGDQGAVEPEKKPRPK